LISKGKIRTKEVVEILNLFSSHSLAKMLAFYFLTDLALRNSWECLGKGKSS
jgi:hypothetical protein